MNWPTILGLSIGCALVAAVWFGYKVGYATRRTEDKEIRRAENAAAATSIRGLRSEHGEVLAAEDPKPAKKRPRRTDAEEWAERYAMYLRAFTGIRQGRVFESASLRLGEKSDRHDYVCGIGVVDAILALAVIDAKTDKFPRSFTEFKPAIESLFDTPKPEAVAVPAAPEHEWGPTGVCDKCGLLAVQGIWTFCGGASGSPVVEAPDAA